MQLWLIPLLPLAGFRAERPVWPAIVEGRDQHDRLRLGAAVVLVGSEDAERPRRIFGGGNALDEAYREHYFTWIQSGMLNISVDFAIDRLTAVMLMIVTGVGFLIHVYAVGYMAHEGGYYRFFAYLNLFMFFMLVLVLAANFLLLFVGWEGVGLCSYLLIGFYFLEKFATDAANKAFIVNRIGDFGFSLARLPDRDPLRIARFRHRLRQGQRHARGIERGMDDRDRAAAAASARAGKSAQIPLYVWLPDAMAGPTPVSALIHAATMVTAGVYMVARSSQIFLHAHGALEVVALIGLATAFFAATIGLAQNDIKKVYAYSTVSQLGYMFLGLGTGAFSAGIFHVMTHAFFKALLFLGAGSVIHALSGEQDLRKMGGLRKYTPITMWTLLCGSVAIAGVPPFSGFYSKDAILAAAYDHAPWMYWVGVFTAGMTAFYVFRAFFMTFFGEYRGEQEARAHGACDRRGHDARSRRAARIAAGDVDSSRDPRGAELDRRLHSIFRSSWTRCSRWWRKLPAPNGPCTFPSPPVCSASRWRICSTSCRRPFPNRLQAPSAVRTAGSITNISSTNSTTPS